jgi:hypothetical protein
MAHFDLS